MTDNVHVEFVKERWLPAHGNVDAMVECLTDDATYTVNGTTLASGAFDKDGYREMQKWLLGSLPRGERPEVEFSFVSEGDTVVVVFQFRSTDQSAAPPPSPACQVLRFASCGRIREALSFVDTEWLARLLEERGSSFPHRG